MEKLTLQSILESACQELRDYLEGESAETLSDNNNETKDGQCIGDLISEISDSNVPTYNYDLLELAQDESEIALNEPEIGHGVAGNNPIGLIQANVYEAINNELYAELDRLKEGAIEEEELEEEEAAAEKEAEEREEERADVEEEEENAKSQIPNS